MAVKFRDYYEVMGVPKTASEATNQRVCILRFHYIASFGGNVRSYYYTRHSACSAARTHGRAAILWHSGLARNTNGADRRFLGLCLGQGRRRKLSSQ